MKAPVEASEEEQLIEQARIRREKLAKLISEGKIDTTHLITHRFPLSRIQEAYTLFANRADNVIKTAIHPD